MVEIERICKICGKPFPKKKTAGKPSNYCSDECRTEGVRRYEREREQNTKYQRLWQKKQTFKTITQEMFDRMLELAKEQQVFKYKKKDYCEICGKHKNELEYCLVAHHVSFDPYKIVTLCRRCHDLLHHWFIGKKVTYVNHGSDIE